MIHMKWQVLFSLKIKSECRPLQICLAVKGLNVPMTGFYQWHSHNSINFYAHPGQILKKKMPRIASKIGAIKKIIAP